MEHVRTTRADRLKPPRTTSASVAGYDLRSHSHARAAGSHTGRRDPRLPLDRIFGMTPDFETKNRVVRVCVCDFCETLAAVWTRLRYLHAQWSVGLGRAVITPTIVSWVFNTPESKGREREREESKESELKMPENVWVTNNHKIPFMSDNIY